MKTSVISYSLTGNNEALADAIAAALGSGRARIKEDSPRTMGRTAFDMLFGRTPRVSMEGDPIADRVVFVGPVWMGKPASPFRACFREMSGKLGDYAFVSLCGGADGPNENLSAELAKGLGKAPAAVVELRIASLLPAEPKPARADTSAYRVTPRDLPGLADQAIAGLGSFGALK